MNCRVPLLFECVRCLKEYSESNILCILSHLLSTSDYLCLIDQCIHLFSYTATSVFLMNLCPEQPGQYCQSMWRTNQLQASAEIPSITTHQALSLLQIGTPDL